MEENVPPCQFVRQGGPDIIRYDMVCNGAGF